jgi:IclR family KDG regulon transcriptional repressor
MLDKTLLKGLLVIEELASSAKPRGVSEMARKLNISKTSMHRLLQTLASKRYVAQDEGGTGYYLTMRLWEISAQVTSRIDVKRVGGTHLRLLADKTGESAHMTVLEGSEVVYIDKIDGRQPLRAFTPIAGRAPAYCVATGKALLACQTDGFVDQLEGRLKPFTKCTITSLVKLRKELKDARRLGYAVNRCEWRDDICSIGAVVYDVSGNPIAGIGISGPVQRLQPKAIKRIGPLVMETASSISRELGFRG